MHMEGRLQVFSGNANLALAKEISACLNMNLGRALVTTFKNGETRIKIEENVRGSDVFIVQPTCIPVNENLMELLILIDAVKRASAARITAVIPYYGYAKQEKKTTGREPISAKLVANLIRTAGAHRVLTMDLHAPAIEGFFDIPVDHLQAGQLLSEYVRGLNLKDPVVISPDAGGVGRANEFRERIGASLAIIAKQRPRPDTVEMIEMVGDVAGRPAVIVDDMISTGGTLVEAAKSLLQRGATHVYACATHGIFAGDGLTALRNSQMVETIVTDTIPQSPEAANSRVRTISVAPLFAEAILRIHKDLSLSALFSYRTTVDVIDVPLHWLGILVCMLAIGLASAAEAAMSSISRRQLNGLHHSSRATLVYDLINDAYRFKVSLLLLNTMALIGLTALTVGLVQSLPIWYQFGWLLALTVGIASNLL